MTKLAYSISNRTKLSVAVDSIIPTLAPYSSKTKLLGYSLDQKTKLLYNFHNKTLLDSIEHVSKTILSSAALYKRTKLVYAALTTQYLEVYVGALQLVSCQDIITLTGTVVGSYIGHTFYWEQTAGPIVTWLESQNQLTVMFQKPSGTIADLYFRLWIDRGTAFEQFKETIVTGAARENIVYATSNKNTGAINSAPTGISASIILPGPSAIGTVTYNNPVKTLVWTNPTATYPSYYLYNELYLNSNGTQTLLATLPPSASSYTSSGVPSLNALYTIRSWINVLNSGILQYTDTTAPGDIYDTTIPTLDASDAITLVQLKLETTGVSSYFATQLVSLTNLDNIDTVNTVQLVYKTNGVMDLFQTQLLTLTNIPQALDDNIAVVS